MAEGTASYTDACMRGAEGLTEQVAQLTLMMQTMRTELLANMTQSHAAHAHAHSHKHEDHHYHWSIKATTTPWYHIIIDVFNFLGVAIMVISALGTIPMMLVHVLPAMVMNGHGDATYSTTYVLKARMQLGRGIMLGMDFMVTSDVIETLCGEIDIVKLICIVVVRSWLGYERSKEVEHMSHELDHWNKAQQQLLNTIGTSLDDPDIDKRIAEVFAEFDSDDSGDISHTELKDALAAMGVKISTKEANTMVSAAGEDGMTLDRFGKLIRKMLVKAEKERDLSSGNRTPAPPPSPGGKSPVSRGKAHAH